MATGLDWTPIKQDDLQWEPIKKPEESNWDYAKGIGDTFSPIATPMAIGKNIVEDAKDNSLMGILKQVIDPAGIDRGIISGVKAGKAIIDKSTQDQDEPVTHALRVAQGVLREVPVLGDAISAGDLMINGDPTQSKRGTGQMIGHGLNVALPMVSPSIGKVAGKVGERIYKSTFPENVPPAAMDLMIKEGISGSQKGMVGQINNKLKDSTHEMANFENANKGNPSLKVDYRPTTRMMSDTQLNDIGPSGLPNTPSLYDAIDRRNDYLIDRAPKPLSFDDAIALKRGAELEGKFSNAFNAKDLTPNQLASNMAVGGMIKDVAKAAPEYGGITSRISNLIDAREAAQGAKPLRPDLPYRFGAPAILSAEAYRTTRNPIMAALTGGASLEAQKALSSPRGLTNLGLGGIGISKLLQNPAIRAALLGGDWGDNAQQ